MAYGFRAHLMNLAVYSLGLIPLTLLIIHIQTPEQSFNRTVQSGPFDNQVPFQFLTLEKWLNSVTLSKMLRPHNTGELLSSKQHLGNYSWIMGIIRYCFDLAKQFLTSYRIDNEFLKINVVFRHVISGAFLILKGI